MPLKTRKNALDTPCFAGTNQHFLPGNSPLPLLDNTLRNEHHRHSRGRGSKKTSSDQSSSLRPLAYPSLPPLKVSLSLGAPLGPDAIGVPTLETAAVERPSAGVASSKSWRWGCLYVSSFSLATVAACAEVSVNTQSVTRESKNEPRSYRHLDRVDCRPRCRAWHCRTEDECPPYIPSDSDIPSY